MGLFDKFKKRNGMIIKNDITNLEADKTNFIKMNNYMLSDVRKENLSTNCYSLSLSKITKLSPIAIPTANAIKTITISNM